MLIGVADEFRLGMKPQPGEGIFNVILYGVQGKTQAVCDFHVLAAPVQQLQHSLFRLGDSGLETWMADNVLMPADASQGALNVLKVEQGVGIYVLNVVNTGEVALAEVLNDPELVVSEVRFAAFVLVYKVSVCFRVEVLNILDHEADHFPIRLFKPVGSPFLIHVPDLIFERIKFNFFHTYFYLLNCSGPGHDPGSLRLSGVFAYFCLSNI